MLQISGYKTGSLIYNNARTAIYRARREQDDLPVVIKTVATELVSLASVARYRHSFLLTKELNHPGICQTLALIEDTRRPILVMEDIEGTDLHDLIKQGKISIETTLSLAIQVCDALQYMHSKQIVHKDIKPGNLIYNPDTQKVQLIDFLLSSRLTTEQADWDESGLMEGTIAYIAPEQTGRVNRHIDHRTDLYSLGVTLYEMLTDRLPFEEEDYMAMVYAHMAVPPPPPSSINPSIPEPLSQIIMKLLEKIPEQRYQSVFGLKSDLKLCLKQWQSTGTIRPFSLASKDTSPNLNLSQHIYGRGAEVRSLLSAFERVGEGAVELFLISGFSGVGKTALARELYTPITARRGRFIQGKYDPLENAPHVGLIQALETLVQEVMSMQEEQFQYWKTKLQDAVGHVGQVLVELLPNLEKILGPQQALPSAPANEAQSRMLRVVQRFIQTFASEEQPLVLFLDDLQWASGSSVQLLFQLLKLEDLHHVMFIGTYRDNEVPEGHPLAQEIKTYNESSEDKLNEAALLPLKEEDVNHWIADSLNLSQDRTGLLTEEIYNKTQGNPFFTERFLLKLHERKGLWLDSDTNQWKWDIKRIQGMDFTENVTEFMANELHKLPTDTLDLLQKAACLGNVFDLNVLGQIMQTPMEQLTKAIFPALQEGVLLPIGTSYRLATLSLDELAEIGESNVKYRFIHDRLKEAALGSQSSEDHQTFRFAIGAHLLEKTNLEENPKQVFSIVNQWNHCLSMFQSEAEKEKLLQLNLQAAQRAMEATAYQQALVFANICVELLPKEPKQDSTAFQTYLLQAEAAQTSGDFELAEEAELNAAKHAQNTLEKCRAYSQRLTQVLTSTDAEKIEERCWDLLALFVEKPEEPEAIDALAQEEWARVHEILSGRSVEDLVNLPRLNNPEIEMEIRSLAKITYLFIWVPQLQQLTLSRTIRLSLEHGNSVEAPLAYMNYAIALAAQGKIEEAHQFGQLALNVNDLLNDAQSSRRATLEQIYGPHVSHWYSSLEESSVHVERAIQLGLEHGNMEAIGYSLINELWIAIPQGSPLPELLATQQKAIPSLVYYSFPSLVPIIAGLIYSSCVLVGKPEISDLLAEQGMPPEEPLLEQLKQVFPSGARELEYRRLERFLYLEEYDKALESAESALQLQGFGLPTVPLFHWHHSVLLCILYPKADQEKQSEYKAILEKNMEELRKWGITSPANTHHLYLHIAAELAVLQEEFSEAESLFDEAIAHAQRYQRLNAEGLILERASHYYTQQSKDRVARAFLIDAYNSYGHWQVKAKTTLLEEQYPHLLSHSFEHSITTSRTSSSTQQSHVLDLHSILQTNQAIAEEISLEKLLQTTLSVVIQNAGAESGALLLPKTGGLFIEAMRTPDQEVATVLQSLPPTDDVLAASIVHYVQRTKERVVLDNASESRQFASDPYILKTKVKSLLCSPLLKNKKLVGILYLENNQMSKTFNEQRCAVLDMITSQAAVSIENARLYSSMEEKVAERTSELQHATKRLENTYQNLATKHRQLQEAQVQLVQSEKMAGLGTLVAGVAHEINNPCNYSYNSAQSLNKRLQDFKAFIYELAEAEQNSDLDKMFSEKFAPMHRSLESIIDGTHRIRGIVNDLRTFSRLDEAEYKRSNVIENLRASLSLLQTNYQKDIHFVFDFEQDYEFECWAAQLNQAFMNIMLNAIQAIQAKELSEGEKGTLRIQVSGDSEVVNIHFIDDGVGMNENVVARMFEPFFTTRQVGDGTGLGLSITFGIIEKHKGKIDVISKLGEGTTVSVQLPLHVEQSQ